jgi:hypothetical protein
MKIWRFTGNPENWITAVSISNWALNENNKSLWENHITPGDIILMHATKKSDFHPDAESSVIGIAFVGEGLYIKSDFWWVQEIRDKQNYWPYVVPLKEIYIFSDTSNLDINTPVDKKILNVVKDEIDILLNSALRIKDLERIAKGIDRSIPGFPMNGSASGVNPIYEEIILNIKDDYYPINLSQDDVSLEKRLNESVDDKLATLPKDKLMEDAKNYKQIGNAYVTKTIEKKIRKENQFQKRRVAKIEDYTCQVCGFYEEYTRANGKKGWIIEVDHILDKAKEGSEDLKNLWVLCPNCHAKKTYGLINIDLTNKTITNNGKLVIITDNHLFTDL